MAPKCFKCVPHPKQILLYPICNTSSALANAEDKRVANYESVDVLLRLTFAMSLQ